MQRFWKRGAAFVLSLCVAVACCGCLQEPVQQEPERPTPPPLPVTTPPPPMTEPPEHPLKQAYKENPVAFVEFSRASGHEVDYVPVEEVLAYESQYPDCGGTWFRDRMEPEDRCIYNSYLYAMEHCFTGFTLYVEDNDRDFAYIRQALSMDLPFVEQNINLYGEDTFDRANTHWGESLYFAISQFSQDRWEMKLEALERCRQIVAQIPAEYETQLQKMEYLHRYVCDHVQYVEYESMNDEDYLYDAVIKGKTVCDGYSNMLSLLFHLIGVECCEATGSNVLDYETATEEELENAAGHTWVVARIDGEFYNFDPTYEDTKGEDLADTTMFFGFSDSLVEQKYWDCEDIRPKCTDLSRDFPYADLIISKLSEGSQIKKLVRLAEKQKDPEGTTLLIAIREVMDDGKYDKLFKDYRRYAQKPHRVETVYSAMGSYTLLWLTVIPE